MSKEVNWGIILEVYSKCHFLQLCFFVVFFFDNNKDCELKLRSQNRAPSAFFYFPYARAALTAAKANTTGAILLLLFTISDNVLSLATRSKDRERHLFFSLSFKNLYLPTPTEASRHRCEALSVRALFILLRHMHMSLHSFTRPGWAICMAHCLRTFRTPYTLTGAKDYWNGVTR